jgi:sugar/nucleoside kinase (ribokinase family)
MQTVPDHATGAAFVAYEPDGSREFVFHLRHAAAGALAADRLDPVYFAGVDWLHLSGSTIALNPNSRATCLRALELTQAAGGRVSFDPNLRPELMPVVESREAFAPFLKAADLLLPTAEEARALTGTPNDDAAVQKLLANREGVVMLKRGGEGCTLYAGSEKIAAAGFAVPEVDPTGAGDCFNAACIVGLEAGWPLAQVARFACAAGALAVTQQGPMEGAPARSAVEAMLN